MKNPPPPLLLLLAALLAPAGAQGAEVLVQTQAAFAAAAAAAKPGDTLVLADGEWRDFQIVFTGRGTADAPITLTAQTPGGVVLTGQSNLRLGGEHLVVSRLVFRDGHSPTNAVISFRKNRELLANNSRVSEVVVDGFTNPERHERDFWVLMFGRNNRFDHNHLAGKSNAGVTMAVRLDAEESRDNNHLIDHNWFGPRPVLGSNGGETLRIGTSHYSLSRSGTRVENNIFERCNGEVEIVSSKSGGNVFRGNLFLESQGTLTLRHGNDNLVERNVFLGNGAPHTGGIRVINKRQTVRGNYLAGLTGHRFGGGLVIMNGVPNSPINRYHQVEDSVVENNTLIDVAHVELAAGSDAERSAPPQSTAFRNNLIVNREAADSIAVHDDLSGISFSGNVTRGVQKAPAQKGFAEQAVELKRAANGLEYPAAARLADVGAPRDLTVVQRAATGVPWYPKRVQGPRFGTGETKALPADGAAFGAAVRAAGEGDVLELQPGEHLAEQVLVLDKAITIRAAAGAAAAAVVRWERSALFEIQDGGALRLEGITFDGAWAPDAHGNSLVRTSRYSMLQNYTLEMDNVTVRNLDTNHSFNVLRVAGHTLADVIVIENSSFENISGHVLALERERDDFGLFNADYVTVANSQFHNIGGAVVDLYRGGTDESTFGPHLIFIGNAIDNAGKNRRNRSRSSLYLLGVQRAEIFNNTIADSAPLRVVETVGEPVTIVRNNQWHNTPAPEIGPIGGTP